MTGIESDKLAAVIRMAKKPALVLFTGEWCGDCRAFEPVWNRWVSGRIGSIYEVEVSREGDEWEEWTLDEIPTVVSFVGGGEIGRVHGAIKDSDLDRLWQMTSHV